LDFDQAAANRLWWFDLAAEDRLARKIAAALLDLQAAVSGVEPQRPVNQEIEQDRIW
jgi:hypothetical protein